MPSPDQVFACYGELAGTVARMLELARDRRWDTLPGLDARCTHLFGQLREMEAEEEAEDFSSGDRCRLAALASRIRADQEALTSLVRPQFVRLVQRMAELQRPA